MSHLPIQVPWRDFVRVLRALGYTPAKSKAGWKRYVINPPCEARVPSPSMSPTPETTYTGPSCADIFESCSCPEEDFLRLLENG